MSAKNIKAFDTYRFSETSITELVVDSTTQQLLVTPSGNPEIFFIGHLSVVKTLLLKPGDNTANIRGIPVPPGIAFFLPANITVPVYGIMDSGGVTTISITRFF